MSVIYETDQDLTNQQKVMAIINGWMNGLPAIGGKGNNFHYKEIKTVAGESKPDFELWWSDHCTGVVEIKCHMMRVKKRHDALMISRGKLLMLYKQYQLKGTPAMLAYGVFVEKKLSEVLFADLRTLIYHRDKWKNAEKEHSSTTDHGRGKRASPDECYLIPTELFWSLKKPELLVPANKNTSKPMEI